MAEAALQTGALEDLLTTSRGVHQWLASGRLQAENGAYCAWLDAATGTLAFAYPEITGYALTWLAGCPDPGDAELAAGHRAADWLVSRLASGNRAARTSWDGGAIYTFDLGMIAAGLLSFGKLVGAERYVEQGLLTARALAGYIDSASGLTAIAPDGPPSGRPIGWSTAGRSHLVKCVQALLLADEREAASRLVRDVMASQSPDGRFTTQPGEDRVMLHPHLYAVEGVWMWGSACNESEVLDSARKAILWVWKHQLPSGGMPRWVSASASGPEQVDVTSQAIRAAGMLDIQPAGLEAATARLAACAHTDGEHGSAFIYQPDAEETHLNAWVTMFADQALTVTIEGRHAVKWDTIV